MSTPPRNPTPTRLREPAPEPDGTPTPEAAPAPHPQLPRRESRGGKRLLREVPDAH